MITTRDNIKGLTLTGIIRCEEEETEIETDKDSDSSGSGAASGSGSLTTTSGRDHRQSDLVCNLVLNLLRYS